MLHTKTLLIAATLAAVTGAAHAQRPGNIPGTNNSLPLSDSASNISPADTRSPIAPRLPAPADDRDLGPKRLLIDARRALESGQTGLAQEALERAETRLLDRVTPTERMADPSRNPRVHDIHAVLEAIAVHDRGTALARLDTAIGSFRD